MNLPKNFRALVALHIGKLSNTAQNKVTYTGFNNKMVLSIFLKYLQN